MKQAPVTNIITLIWQARGVWLALAALGCACYGQSIVRPADVVAASHWYALAVLLLIVAWFGRYKNRDLLPTLSDQPAYTAPRVPTKTTLTARSRTAAPVATPATQSNIRRYWRLAVLALAGLLNLGAVLLLRGDYGSLPGVLLWLASLIVLPLALFGYKPQVAPALALPDEAASDPDTQTDFKPPRWLEIGLVVAIVVLAFACRAYRLGDPTAGMSVDEGGFGQIARFVLDGDPLPVFATSWEGQENLYFWLIAGGMQLFGSGLFGARIVSALIGTAMVVPFYLLLRQLFGVRLALAASTLLAVMEVAVHTSRLALNNIPIPALLFTALYFLFAGLRSQRPLQFALAGYCITLGLYFYYGGRLTPFIILALLLYLFIAAPLIRPPKAGLRARFALLLLRLRAYGLHLAILALAALLMASPWISFAQDNPDLISGHTGEKLIFGYPIDRWQALYPNDVTTGPLYIGLQWPDGADPIPLPLVFAQTPLSLRLLDDGGWARTLWRQLTVTLGMFTVRGDFTDFYPFDGRPIVQDWEAALLVLGLAWAFWRWRDARMAMLLLVFWPTIIVGGVLTVDAPYLERLPAMLPALAVLIALPLDKLAAEIVRLFNRRAALPLPAPARVARSATAVALFAVLAFLAGRNIFTYQATYMDSAPDTIYVGHALATAQTTAAVHAENRPTPLYYNLGAHMISWDQNTNRFINYGVEGRELYNPSNDLPLVTSRASDAVIEVWDLNRNYLSALAAYYPAAQASPFTYGTQADDRAALTQFRIKQEDIAANRTVTATYPALIHPETAFGTTAPPSGLLYPAPATWTGGLIAPNYTTYRFRADGGQPATLKIDGLTVFAAPANEGAVVLARGPHQVELAATLGDADNAVTLLWASGDGDFIPIEPQYLWTGPGRGLLGMIYDGPGAAAAALPLDPTAWTGLKLLQARVDGLVGFRNFWANVEQGAALADWAGTLNIASPGAYNFQVRSAGEMQLLLDGQPVATRAATADLTASEGQVSLSPGPHTIELRQRWTSGSEDLDLLWMPPNTDQYVSLGPDVLSTAGGAWAVGSVPDPNPLPLPQEPDFSPYWWR